MHYPKAISSITEDELVIVCEKVEAKTALGLDRMPNVARSEWFISIFNTCLEVGVFPTQWKKQMLLPKSGKPPIVVPTHLIITQCG